MFIERAILSINPNASFTVIDEDINNIQWHNTTPISVSDIQTKINQIQTEYNNNSYQRNREIEYPTITDQLDMQYHDAVNGTTTWKDKIKSIKDKYPKPSE